MAAVAINSDAWRTTREFIYIDRLDAVPRQYINNEINPAIGRQLNAAQCRYMQRALPRSLPDIAIVRVPVSPWMSGNFFHFSNAGY